MLKMVKKLNIGCGKDYRKGFINLDFNREVKADIYWDLNLGVLPFEDNEFDYVLCDNVLEHVKGIFPIMDELHRICKPKAIIEIYVPHFTSPQAFSHLCHYRAFGIGSFGIYTPEEVLDGERYGDARFNILKEKLLYFNHDPADFPFLKYIPINWIFNLGNIWQLLCQKFLPLRWDEIYYKLEVVKSGTQ